MLDNLSNKEYENVISFLMKLFKEDRETIEWNLSFKCYENEIKEYLNDR